MKYFLLAIIITLFISAWTSEGRYDSFCEGWKDGYKEGWCYELPHNCITPIVPLCPLPELYRDTYIDGYNRGFLKGLSDYENQ